MKRDGKNKLLRLLLMAWLVIGFSFGGVQAAFDRGAAAQETGGPECSGAANVCSARDNDLPMAMVCRSNATEFAPLRTDKLPQDKPVFGAVAFIAASARIRGAVTCPNTELRTPSSHSLVTRHVRLQI